MKEYILRKHSYGEFCCTGVQLLKLLQIIEEKTQEGKWVVGDIETTHGNSFINGNTYYTTEELKTIAGNINQFIWGTFIYFKDGEKPKGNKKILTESEEAMHFKNSYIEIRCFDTSYFEMYSGDKEIISLLESIKI